jgi:hypothetical protein
MIVATATDEVRDWEDLEREGKRKNILANKASEDTTFADQRSDAQVSTTIGEEG